MFCYLREVLLLSRVQLAASMVGEGSIPIVGKLVFWACVLCIMFVDMRCTFRIALSFDLACTGVEYSSGVSEVLTARYLAGLM